MHFFFLHSYGYLLAPLQYLICICLQTTLLLLEYKSIKVSYADVNDAKISEDTPLMTFSFFLPCSLSPWSVWILASCEEGTLMLLTKSTVNRPATPAF